MSGLRWKDAFFNVKQLVEPWYANVLLKDPSRKEAVNLKNHPRTIFFVCYHSEERRVKVNVLDRIFASF